MFNSQAHINVEMDVKELLAEILEKDLIEIKNDAHFVKDLGMDSMMALEVLASLEKKYRIVIPEQMLIKFVNVNTTVEIVKNILKENKKI